MFELDACPADGSAPIRTGHRLPAWACPDCDVGAGSMSPPKCWCCGVPMLPYVDYRRPTAAYNLPYQLRRTH